ncbi:hypothetical protein OX284_010035 [Flavobacterium sp. SUN046]|uniref:hypothetical protein n=1 Tax=Flavobacterium sp. SUN046 TaxID=3002440 RepID=UPI002DB6568C|nr:hypothetical protein [Flavobacterium sp. SUN046]MEC4049766.1 hypothetical protein [Flavobacterium sp. SUN046]
MKNNLKEFLVKNKIDFTENNDNLTVGGYLDLQGTSITSLPDNLTVGGSLDLRGTSITSLPDNLTVGGSLDLRGTSITSLPDNLTVGGYLDLQGTSITSLPDNLTVGGSLYLQGTSITSLPDNLTVGGYLDLQGTSITSLPDNLTVGGYLDLQGTSITSLPDNLTVGGSVYTPNNKEIEVKKPLPNAFINSPKNKLLFWKNGKYVSADGIFTELVNKKGNIYKVRKLHSTKEFYLVSDGKTHAHGDTLKKAKEDFEFKLISEKIKNEPINADTIIDVNYYRLVTGACELGCKDFIKQNNLTKDKYRADELLPLLEKTNAYGVEKFKSLIVFNDLQPV